MLPEQINVGPTLLLKLPKDETCAGADVEFDYVTPSADISGQIFRETWFQRSQQIRIAT